jgi:hypothetical protein
MRRITVIAAALLAVSAISVVSVASASAALPEFKTTGLKFSSSGKAAVLRTAESEVECKKSKGSGGLVKEAKVTTGLVITFEECKENKTGVTCSNIKTSKLHGVLYYINAEKHEVGTALTPEGTTTFATFTCFFSNIEVKGCSTGSLSPVNTEVEKFTAKFEASVRPPATECPALTATHEGKTEAAAETSEGTITIAEKKKEEILA